MLSKLNAACSVSLGGIFHMLPSSKHYIITWVLALHLALYLQTGMLLVVSCTGFPGLSGHVTAFLFCVHGTILLLSF